MEEDVGNLDYGVICRDWGFQKLGPSVAVSVTRIMVCGVLSLSPAIICGTAWVVIVPCHGQKYHIDGLSSLFAGYAVVFPEAIRCRTASISERLSMR